MATASNINPRRKGLRLYHVLLCLLGALVATLAVWWWLTRDERAARARANQSLIAFTRNITPQNYKRYGFQSYSEVSHLTLGTPVTAAYVDIDDLKSFSHDSNPQSVIKDSDEQIFPVLASGQGRVLIRVSKHDSGWMIDSIGEADVARNLASLENKRRSLPSSDVVQTAVDVPSMRLCFALIGNLSSSEPVRLTPLNDSHTLEANGAFKRSEFLAKHPSFNATTTGEVDAREVLGTLASEAKRMTGIDPLGESPVPVPNKPITNEEKKKDDTAPGPTEPLTNENQKRGTTAPTKPIDNASEKENIAPVRKVSIVYVVKKGDCLATIAQRYYHRQIWTRIYSANTDVIKNPNLIRPRWKLRIPLSS